MKKIMCGQVNFVVVGLITIFFALSLVADENISVTVSGTAPVANGNVSKARTMALMSAKGSAVEQAAGMIISLYQLDEVKKVSLSSQGKVLDYHIISEQEKDGIYTVQIKASVLFPDDFSKSGVKARPAEFEPNAYTAHVVETEKGSIDWENGYVMAQGKGLLGKDALDEVKARRVALVNAYANALEIIESISVDAQTRVKDMAADEKIMVELKATIQGARIVAEHKDEATSLYNVVVRVPFWGVNGLQKVLLTHVLDNVTARQHKRKMPSDKVKTDGTVAQTSQSETSTPDKDYTGIVIDARETDVKPGLFPAVYDENGETVYSVAQADSETVAENGVVSYVEHSSQEAGPAEGALFNEVDDRGSVCSPMLASLSSSLFFPLNLSQVFYLAAQNAPAPAFPRRSGPKPLVIKGLESGGQNKTEIRISREDAAKISQSAELQESLKSCRVVVVVRSEAGGTEGRYFDHRYLWGQRYNCCP